MSGKPPKGEKELALVGKCIIKTMRRFRESPSSFWSEDDIRCYLKQLLLKGRLFRSGRLGNVFLSFPTRNTYARQEDGVLYPSPAGRSEFFDIAGWAPPIPTTGSPVTQGLSFAIELRYLRAIHEDWAVQIRNALTKLGDEANGVPQRGRFFLLLTAQQVSALRDKLNSLFAEFPSVRCYQQLAQ